MSDEKLTLEQLDELEQHFTKQLDDEEEKEQLYEQQAEEISKGLTNGKKVNDGYYSWALAFRKNNNCVIIAARNMLFGQKGYTPMMGEFTPNPDSNLYDSIKESVKIMLKRQNGEYVAEEV